MTDIELVIKISEEEYQNILHTGKANFCAINAIEAGTPLPEGHGRLIDADALMEYCQNDKSKVIDCNDIARFPTIIRRE